MHGLNIVSRHDCCPFLVRENATHTFTHYQRVGKGIFVSRQWSIFCSRKMLDQFSVVKCDLFYSREAGLSIKMLREMRIKDVCFVNCVLLCLFQCIL
jgi:hypothetical protein